MNTVRCVLGTKTFIKRDFRSLKYVFLTRETDRAGQRWRRQNKHINHGSVLKVFVSGFWLPGTPYTEPLSEEEVGAYGKIPIGPQGVESLPWVVHVLTTFRPQTGQRQRPYYTLDPLNEWERSIIKGLDIFNTGSRTGRFENSDRPNPSSVKPRTPSSSFNLDTKLRGTPQEMDSVLSPRPRLPRSGVLVEL